jgi:hypothetical protein
MKRFFIFMENNRSRTPYKVTIKTNKTTAAISCSLRNEKGGIISAFFTLYHTA